MRTTDVVRNCAFALAITVSASAGAATQTFGLVTPNNETNWGATYALPLFDPGLGTLTGVQFTHSGSFNADVNVFHGAGAGTATLSTLGATVQFSVPGAIIVSFPDVTPVSFAWPAGAGSPTIFERSLSESGILVLEEARWAPYLGTGTFPVQVDVQRILGGLTSVGDFQSLEAIVFGGGNLEVTYSFEPIPEPGTWALMFAGLVSLGFIARRRASQ